MNEHLTPSASSDSGPDSSAGAGCTLDHATLFELIPLGVSGDLEPAEQAALDAHRALCSECRAQWNRFERVLSPFKASRNSGVAAVPPEIRQRIDAAVMASVAERLAERTSVAARLSLWRQIQHPAAAALLTVVAGLGIWFGVPGAKPTPTPVATPHVTPPEPVTPVLDRNRDTIEGDSVAPAAEDGFKVKRVGTSPDGFLRRTLEGDPRTPRVRSAVLGEDESEKKDDFKMPKGAVVPDSEHDQFGQF